MTVETVDLRLHIERGEGIHVLRSHEEQREWNGIRYRIGLSGKNVGSGELSMNVATIPPGAIARAHIHADKEPVVAVVARSDAREWENIISYEV